MAGLLAVIFDFATSILADFLDSTGFSMFVENNKTFFSSKVPCSLLFCHDSIDVQPWKTTLGLTSHLVDDRLGI